MTQRDALLEAANDFIGNGSDDGGDGGGGGLSTFDPEIIGPNSNTPHRVVRNISLGWRRAVAQDLGYGWQAWAAGTLALGQNRHELPEGMGVLTDPTVITLSTISVQPELGVSQQFDIRAVRLRAGAGMGLQVSGNYVTVRSALLDVTSYSLTAAPYAIFSLDLSSRNLPSTLVVEGRLHRDGTAQVRTELRYDLPLRF